MNRFIRFQLFLLSFALGSFCRGEEQVKNLLQKANVKRGVIALVGLPSGGAERVIDLASSSELTVFFQSDQDDQVSAVQQASRRANLLGNRVFVDSGSSTVIQLADNVADCVVVSDTVEKKPKDSEVLRALRPRANGFVGSREITKPVPEGIDDWSHPYHGPDNNPQSNDQLVKGEFRTQFLGFPKIQSNAGTNGDRRWPHF